MHLSHCHILYTMHWSSRDCQFSFPLRVTQGGHHKKSLPLSRWRAYASPLTNGFKCSAVSQLSRIHLPPNTSLTCSLGSISNLIESHNNILFFLYSLPAKINRGCWSNSLWLLFLYNLARVRRIRPPLSSRRLPVIPVQHSTWATGHGDGPELDKQAQPNIMVVYGRPSANLRSSASSIAGTTMIAGLACKQRL